MEGEDCFPMHPWRGIESVYSVGNEGRTSCEKKGLLKVGKGLSRRSSPVKRV